MSSLRCWLLTASLALLLSVSAAHAHLAMAQRGTINIVESGAYLVLSLPVSAFKGIDDDGDGLLSVEELILHSKDIEAQVLGGVELADNNKQYPVDGLMVKIVPPDATHLAPAPQIAVLGRFGTDRDAAGLKFSFKLFGASPNEQMKQITVTRGAETQLMTLTPLSTQQAVFPSLWSIFFNQTLQGMHHIFFGWDHLLFLLVVLSASLGFRHLVLALTCFTAGHAISLTASVLLGIEASSAWVEPAIAATIVGTACFDRWYASRDNKPSAVVRFALVFGCALIHGLGLAGALTQLGIDPAHNVLTLLGFNLGIETAQVLIAGVAVLTLKPLFEFRGARWMIGSKKAVSSLAIGVGMFWFFARLITAG